MSYVKQVLEDNSYTHLISLTTYSLWNHSKCFVGNVYIPTKKHSLYVPIYNFSKVFFFFFFFFFFSYSFRITRNHPSIPSLEILTWAPLIYMTNKQGSNFVCWFYSSRLMIHLFHGVEVDYSLNIDHNYFEILSEELGNEELLADCKVEKFVNITTNSIVSDLLIPSSTEIRKAMFRMSLKIYCL